MFALELVCGKLNRGHELWLMHTIRIALWVLKLWKKSTCMLIYTSWSFSTVFVLVA